MRIYYHGAYEKADVPSGAPVESTENEAKSVFARLADEGSFLGILLGGERTLQLHRQADGTLHAEVLKEVERVIRFCTVNVPLAELLIEAAFRGEDFEQKIAFSRVTWSDDTLKTA
jgi:hypothetical protein